MLKIFLSYLGLLALCSYRVTGQFPDEDARPVAQNVEAKKYAGRWYPTYGNIVEQYYLDNDYCPLNDFVYRNDRSLDGNNTVRVGEVNGTLASTPSLMVFNENGTGNIKYVFFGITIMDYRISKLGPDTFGEHNLYQYAVVWSPNMYNSFILSRDVEDFKENYRTEVFEWMRENGFDSWFLNVEDGEIYQESDCDYPPRPEPEE